MITIAHDREWFSRFNQAMNDLKFSEEESERYANAATETCFLRLKLAKEAEKKHTQIIAPKTCPEVGTKITNKTCKATLMNGNRCSNKAACGEFCRRHRLSV
jgi:hypothetical protein